MTEQKTLFDHLKEITYNQDPNYMDTLTDNDKKTFNVYMINRYLSMEYSYVESISELLFMIAGAKISIENMYKLYITIIPSNNIFLKYMKSHNKVKYTDDIIKLLMEHYKISTRESIEYLNIYFMNNLYKSELITLLKMYGNDDKTIKQLIKTK